MSLHPVTAAVTARIVERSRDSRADYLARMEAAQHDGPGRAKLSCANWAHAFAAESDGVKQRMRKRANRFQAFGALLQGKGFFHKNSG